MSQILPFGEWRPDVSSYNGQSSPTVTNVYPRGDGYGPVKGFAKLSAALAAACRGFYAAFDDSGTMALFAGTAAAELYKMSNTDFSWDTVSAATYAALPTGYHWQFAQFDQYVIAVNGNDDPQSYLMGTSTDFADLGGNPPNSNYVTVVGPFVVLSGLVGDEMKIQWSSRNNPAEWTPGTNEGDVQTFKDGGLVRQVAGGEYGVVFQDNAIRRMTYSPGSAVIFEFDILSRDLGLWAPYSVVATRDMLFFLSNTGFYMWQPMMGFKAIGKERVDRTFFADCDQSQKHLIQGAADPKSSRVIWTYKSTSSGTNTLWDRMIVYDWQLDRWAGWINLQGEYILNAANPGLTLDALDSVGTNIDTLTQPLDSYPTTFGTQLAMADASHAVGLLAGDNLEATLETPEIDLGSRQFVRGCRPLTDSTVALTSIGGRPNIASSVSYSVEHLADATGKANFRTDNRVLRFRTRVPAAATWNYAIGVEPDLVATGQR